MTLMGRAEVIKNCGLDCGERMRNSCSLEKRRYLPRRKKLWEEREGARRTENVMLYERRKEKR